MSQLELLWKLEEQNDLLKKDKMNLDLEIQKKEINNIDSNIKKSTKNIRRLEENILEYDIQIKKEDMKLENFRYKIEEIEDELYSGNITDLKHLEYLNEEKKEISSKINDLELEILSMMEVEEETNKEILELGQKLDNKKEELLKKQEKYEKNLKLVDEKILEEEKTINYINQKIEKDILKAYHNIKNQKERPIVKVKNDICSGCNMRIPTYLISALKNKSELIYCDNCGRILYYNDKLKD